VIFPLDRKFCSAVWLCYNDHELFHVTKLAVIPLAIAKQAQDAVLERSLDPVRCFSALGAGNFSLGGRWGDFKHLKMMVLVFSYFAAILHQKL
jgi:hypothetical protein